MKKVALVTGASRGIGQAILHQLAAQGFYVIGTATSEVGVQLIQTYLKENNLSGEGRVLRVENPVDIEAFFKALSDPSGPGLPTVLVNNAGVTRDNLFMRMSDSEWNEVIQTNLNSVFYLTRACIRSMIKAREGRVITIGSIVGSSGNPGQVNYCATKAGVIGFSKALAREVASRGITVNVVSPGFIQTDMTDKLKDEQKAAILSSVPMGRMGTPKDIADVVGFLASGSAAYITGETIHVNGGMLMD
jgi:3-oxoacyl-[acyl-carrier protein] reductase